MFTSKNELIQSMGVEPEIAAFFVDRKLPEANRYWKGRYLYVAKGTGYLFIPLFFDLQFKAGLPLKQVLEEQYVQRMEQILHLAALYEFGEKEFYQHIREIELLINDQLQNPGLFGELHTYFQQPVLLKQGRIGTDNPPLNRGDALLYLLTTVAMPDTVLDRIIQSWYQLVPSFLLLDDIMDFQEDKETQEENSLSLYGYTAEGVKKAIEVAEANFAGLETLNPVLGRYFRNLLDRKKQTPYFKHILNN
ncbi:hypothetical protein [Flavihumibacter sp. CACIAM 22H1]|uniref:hypothetical protein n=1 Tax=Flavihumibacter sp. CACIAM 22H1 TaxID=1812911 RepID=UPI0007A8947C|nr:hypothetical protein [Flavihumibacter sp. CACIAM 22H1]KYP14685.1 MAG: hypothetical protein A1D16_09810 [Flavihumibacter sp. CACIAM 22H1]